MRLNVVCGVLMLLITCAATGAAGQPRTNASSPDCGQSGPLPATCSVIVFDGDSIGRGAGSTPGHEPDVAFMRALQSPARAYNIAVGGRPVTDCIEHFERGVMPLKNAQARLNLIVFHAGDNDVRLGRTGAETYAAFTQYVTMAHAQGWKVVVTTETPRLDFSSTKAAELNDYNRRLLANQAGSDVVLDWNTDPRFGDLSERKGSPLFTSDWLHPNDAGYAILGLRLAEVVKPLLRN